MASVLFHFHGEDGDVVRLPMPTDNNNNIIVRGLTISSAPRIICSWDNSSAPLLRFDFMLLIVRRTFSSDTCLRLNFRFLSFKIEGHLVFLPKIMMELPGLKCRLSEGHPVFLLKMIIKLLKKLNLLGFWKCRLRILFLGAGLKLNQPIRKMSRLWMNLNLNWDQIKTRWKIQLQLNAKNLMENFSMVL